MTEATPNPLLDGLDDRIKKLEEAVFPPGGPGLALQLDTLSDRISTARDELKRELEVFDDRQTQKIKKVYEILSELEKRVQALSRAGLRAQQG